MKINFKEWKKVAQDDQHSTFQNRDGHQLKVAHKGLHPATRGQLAALPLAEGGMVEADPKNLPEGYRDPKVQALQDPEITGTDLAVMGAGSRLAKAAAPAVSALAADEAGYLKLKASPKLLPRGAQAIQQAEQTAASAATASEQAMAQQKLGRTVDQAKRSAAQMQARKKPTFAQGGQVQDIDLNDMPQEPVQDIDLNQMPAASMDPRAMSSAAAPSSIVEDVDLNRMPASEEQGTGMSPSPSAPPQADPNQPPLDRRSQIIKDMAGYLQGSQQPKIPAPDLTAPVAAPPSPATPASIDPDQMKLMTGALGDAQRGMQAEASALKKQGDENAKLLHDQMEIQKAAQKDYQDHFADIDKERQALTDDIKNGHIDPNHYMDSLSTGSKIATVLGLIASGVGAGMAHQENLAAKFLDKQIENDIQAQKADLGRKETLLSANMRRFGNLNDAANMFRLQRADMLSNQMLEAAAKAQGPLAKARLQQAAAELKLKYAPIQQKLALNKTIATMTQALQKDPSRGMALINAVEQADPARGKELRERFIPGVGLANSAKDKDHVTEVMSSADNTRKGVQDLLTLASTPGAAFSPQMRTKAQTTATLLMGALNKQVTGGGPMSAQEQEMVRSIVADPTRIFSLGANNVAALKTLLKRTNDWMTAETTSRGLKAPDPASSLPPDQQKWVEWARKNPQNPKAKMLLDKLGL